MLLSVLLLSQSYASQTENPSEKSRNLQYKYGMTWGYGGYNPHEQNELLFVGCGGSPSIPVMAPWNSPDGSCNAYEGDTPCDFFLPLLCISKENYNRPCYSIHCQDHKMPKEFYCGWTGGVLALSDPVQGSSIWSKDDADKICAKKFGGDFRMATHADGLYILGMDDSNFCYSTWDFSLANSGGWSYYGYGVKGSKWTRFWVYVEDQHANCF